MQAHATPKAALASRSAMQARSHTNLAKNHAHADHHQSQPSAAIARLPCQELAQSRNCDTCCAKAACVTSLILPQSQRMPRCAPATQTSPARMVTKCANTAKQSTLATQKRHHAARLQYTRDADLTIMPRQCHANQAYHQS